MPPTSLTDAQREILQALLDRYADAQGPVKRETLAGIVECHPVTLSVRMRGLRALGLVGSTSGPRGGYEPTLKAYGSLAATEEGLVEVPIAIGGDPPVEVRDLSVANAHDPDRCRGEVLLEDPVAEFAVGDVVRIGPMPVGNLHVEGVVAEIGTATNTVVVDIDTMETVVEDRGQRSGDEHDLPTGSR